MPGVANRLRIHISHLAIYNAHIRRRDERIDEVDGGTFDTTRRQYLWISYMIYESTILL